MYRFATYAAILSGLPLSSAAAASAAPAPAAGRIEVGADQLFQIAETAIQQGRFDVAERAYRALTLDPDPERRTEARFRLALLLADRLNRVREGATLLRRILDDKPEATRVRLELARLHARMGNRGAAERELRAVQAAGLPPQVERLVRFYRQSLNAEKRVGGSIEVALAPDNNINRATRSDTLGTVIGEFEIDRPAKAKSGIGLALRGQGYARARLPAATHLLVRVNAAASLYGNSRFNDALAGVEAGPELRIGSDRLTLLGGASWRLYGNKPYSRSFGASAAWQHPLGSKAQLRVDLAASRRDNFRNRRDEGTSYNGSISLDRAFSATMGGGLQAFYARENARDPAYATEVTGATLYLYRELGRTTWVATGGFSHLAADAAFPLFGRQRIDNRWSASLAATFRSGTLFGFAPLVRLRWEQNRSTLEVYEYSRRAVEFGVATAF